MPDRAGADSASNVFYPALLQAIKLNRFTRAAQRVRGAGLGFSCTLGIAHARVAQCGVRYKPHVQRRTSNARGNPQGQRHWPPQPRHRQHLLGDRLRLSEEQARQHRHLRGSPRGLRQPRDRLRAQALWLCRARAHHHRHAPDQGLRGPEAGRHRRRHEPVCRLEPHARDRHRHPLHHRRAEQPGRSHRRQGHRQRQPRHL